MAIHKTAGAKVYILTTAVDPNVINAYGTDASAIAYFTALSGWIEIEEVENLGSIGDQSNPINFTSINNRRTRALKGPRDAGTHQIVCGRDPLAAGQIAMMTAQATDYNFPFRVTLADIPPGTTTPTQMYYAGMVMSDPTNLADVNAVTRRDFNVKINTKLYEIAAV